MPLPPRFLDELRARLPVSEVIGRRVALVRAGREYKACCPFHKEKTPSFTVNDDKGFFHCFGCGAHGDVIGFAMRYDNLSFMEAIEQLAGQAGLDVPKPTPDERRQAEREKSLYELVEAACRFFEDCLSAQNGRSARDYLVGRGLDDETIERFRLGYAPAGGGALVRHLTTAGFAEEAMIEAGLARRAADGRRLYGFFRDRVVFPVGDRRGRVVAFGGRLLGGDGPKYINSPDTPLFHKGRLLYGLSRARTAATQGHTVIVAEGYMDVIALVRAGFDAAVAPLGTALTEDQITELWRTSPQPVLCFDGDDAGKRAAWRAADRALPILRPDHSFRFAFLPPGEDPDSLLASKGRTAMVASLEGAQALAEVLWQRELSIRPVDTPESRAGLQAALDGLAARIGDPTVQAFYRRDLRRRLDEALPWRRADGRGRPGGRPTPPRRPSPVRVGKVEDAAPAVLLALVINHPSLFDEVGEALATVEIAESRLAHLRNSVITALSRNPELDSSALCTHLAGVGAGRALDRVLNKHIYNACPGAAPSAGLDKARSGWAEVWRQVEAKRVDDDIRQAVAALGRETSAARFARLRALHDESDDEASR